jgi:hypothetical protein
MHRLTEKSKTILTRDTIRMFILFILICIERYTVAQEIYLENTSKSLYQMEILEPAGMNIDTNLQAILLIPGQPGNDSGIEVLLNGKNEKNERQMLPAFFSQTCQRAAGIISEGPRFKTLIPQDDSTFFPPGIQTWEDIESFCRQANTDLLAVLEVLICPITIQSQLSATGIYVDFSDDPGYTPSPRMEGSPVILASCKTEAVFTWHLYFPGKRIMEVKKTQSVDQINNLHFKSQPEISDYLSEEIPDILDRISTDAAQQFAQLVSPTWANTIRTYFDKGCREMRLASRFLQNGETDKAAALWEKLVTSNNKGISKHARFNLLLICELDGRYSEGLQLAEKLSQEFSMPEAVSYSEILKIRIQEQELLEQQLSKE